MKKITQKTPTKVFLGALLIVGLVGCDLSPTVPVTPPKTQNNTEINNGVATSLLANDVVAIKQSDLAELQMALADLQGQITQLNAITQSINTIVQSNSDALTNDIKQVQTDLKGKANQENLAEIMANVEYLGGHLGKLQAQTEHWETASKKVADQLVSNVQKASNANSQTQILIVQNQPLDLSKLKNKGKTVECLADIYIILDRFSTNLLHSKIGSDFLIMSEFKDIIGQKLLVAIENNGHIATGLSFHTHRAISDFVLDFAKKENQSPSQPFYLIEQQVSQLEQFGLSGC